MNDVCSSTLRPTARKRVVERLSIKNSSIALITNLSYHQIAFARDDSIKLRPTGSSTGRYLGVNDSPELLKYDQRAKRKRLGC